jgi:hypothetical protein
MMNEMLFLGGCPIIRPEGIYLDGRKVISLGIGDVGDLFAYRKEWEPFIAAHLALWRDMNNRFERSEFVTKCPPGIFKNEDIKDPDPVWRSWCASLALTRMMTSATDPNGILPRWNAWANKSSSEVLAGSADMLKWLQEVVLQVGGPDKDKLLEIGKAWGIEIKLPDLPPFSLQQEIIARTEGAFVTTKGILQILGYGANETLNAAGDIAQATAEGLVDTAKQLPGTARWVGVVAAVAAVVVGGGLILYYVPRKPSSAAQSYG